MLSLGVEQRKQADAAGFVLARGDVVRRLRELRRFGALAQLKREAGVAPIAYSTEEALGRDELWKAVLHHTALGVAPASSTDAEH